MTAIDPPRMANGAAAVVDGARRVSIQALATARTLPHAGARLLAWLGVRASRRFGLSVSRGLFRLSLLVAPRRARTWLHLGRVLRHHDRGGESRDAFERALALDPTSREITVAAVGARPRGTTPDRIGYVLIDTTGLCNASCLHCPTGKPATADNPRVPMAIPLFERLIDELAELALPITGHIGFGLFGDALVDPFVVARARYVRERFPSTPIAINTNAAAFHPDRHAALRPLGVTIALHCESLRPAVFDTLMAPLRLERVLPKYEQILDRFAGHVHVTIPVSRRNRDEVAHVRDWFVERGAEVFLAPLMSRCTDDLDTYHSLALRPIPMRCTSAILDDLVIDCDGKVLRCCQDFRRAEPIGDLADVTLRDIVFGDARRRHGAMLDAGHHAQSATCRRCFTDPPVHVHELAACR